MNVCDYEYQASIPSILGQMKEKGWEIIPQESKDPLGAYMGHHVGFEPAIYMRRLINA